MSETVAAVVVTYNRKELLAECLEALLNQTRPVDKIIIIDNASTDRTTELLTDRGYRNKAIIEYHRLSENTGGAGGFHEGVKIGYEAGYDWLWLMDDDAEPHPDALEIMGHYFTNDGIVGVANLKVGENGIPQYGHVGWFDLCNTKRVVRPITNHDLNASIKIDFSSFVGIAVSSLAIRKIGFPKKEFFIHYDDNEYCSRLRTVGNIYLIVNSIITHKDERNKHYEIKRFLGRESTRTSFSGLWITYFGLRNHVWLIKQGCKNYKKVIFLIATRLLAGIIIYDSHKYVRIRYYFSAIIAGLCGDFDNNRPRNILNKLVDDHATGRRL